MITLACIMCVCVYYYYISWNSLRGCWGGQTKRHDEKTTYRYKKPPRSALLADYLPWARPRIQLHVRIQINLIVSRYIYMCSLAANVTRVCVCV